METITLHDIIAIFKRRRRIFAITTLAIFAIAVLFALNFSRYRASATIEIQQPYVPQNITNVTGESTNNALGLADRRISQIKQNVTSIESLNAIISKLDLYPGANKTLPANKLADIMRSKIQLNFISSTVANPAALQKESVEQLSAIAFTLSYEYNDAEKTKTALDELVKSFIAEEANQRIRQSQETSEFIDTELGTLEATIKEQEQKIAQFRAQYGESGPSAVLFNQQATMSTTMNLQNIESQISTGIANIGTLRGQLAATEPYLPIVDEDKVINSPSGQLKTLRAQLATLSGRYGPEHPDVIKVREQLAALKAQGVSVSGNSVKRDADNPTYLQLAAQLSAAEAQQRALTAQRDNLKQQQEKYAKALAQNPLIEEQMSQLTLDLDNAKERYRTLKDRKLSATMKQKLDSGTNNERLRVINPPSVPDHTSPKRSLIMIAGLILALIGGTAMVILAEMMAQTVRGAHHMAALVGIAPLVIVPYIEKKA